MIHTRPVFVTIILMLAAGGATGQHRLVDFRFAPESYLTAICLPDDWQKTLVSEKGALAYDFGPGPYARPLTEIAVGLKEKELRVQRQFLQDPRVPIVTTVWVGEGIMMQQQAFALIPQKPQLHTPKQISEKILRFDGLNGCLGWASPAGKFDPAFRNVAWGNNRPIKYRIKVTPGSKKRVAMGICESYKPRAGMRILELHVEGAAPLTIDPMEAGEKNRPYVFLLEGQDENRDGRLAIEVHASPKSPDPNVLLNAFWIFPERAVVTAEEILQGMASSKAETYFDCGADLEITSTSPRIDGIVVSISAQSTTPIITVRSPREFTFDSTAGMLRTNGLSYLLSRPRAISGVKVGDHWALELPKGTTRAEIILVHGGKGRGYIRDVPDLQQQMRRAKSYWHDEAPTPKNKIFVPDSAIQYLLEANIRNLYQVREIVDGHLQFQPGPTVYRGLWLADVMLSGIPVAMFGDTASLQRFLENGMRYQLSNGQLRVMYPTLALNETPVFIYTMCWFAQSTGNLAWLRKKWSVVTKGIEWIHRAREQTLSDPAAPYHGLMPPGFVDGGISTPTADYGSLWWAMIAVEKSIEAACWLSQYELAEQWQKLLGEFMVSFRQAARHDLRKDRHGYTFLPISIADTAKSLPQKGQYAFLLPLRYGKFFYQHDALLDSIVRGNLAMLDATTKEGLVVSSGWLHNGVWPWLGGIHAMAHHLFGNSSRAHDLLYAYANHAAPTGTWVEEQQIKDIGNATAGDVSNAEASAVFIHLVRLLLVNERLDDLELLTGVPPEWLAPNAKIELNEIWTDFGPVTLQLIISSDGNSGSLYVAPIDGRRNKGKPVIFLQTLKKNGFVNTNGQPLPDKVDIAWGKAWRMNFRKIDSM